MGLIERHEKGVAGATLQLQDVGEHNCPGCGGWLMAIPWMESGELHLANAAIIEHYWTITEYTTELLADTV